MLYKEIIKTLAARRGEDLFRLAESLGIKPNTLYQRLKTSWNPHVHEMKQMLDELGYEIAFVPKGFVSGQIAEVCFTPEFPERPSKNEQ